ncbi:MAG: hypothetical protein Q9213_004900 [Squamulea squamosa]
MDYFRPRKQPEILDPLNPDFLKRKPASGSQEPQQLPQQGDLAPSSIFEEDAQKGSAKKSQPGQPRVSPRDPTVLAAALDPNPEARRRWQRNQIIRNVRNRGQLTKAQKLARTERESLSKSPFYTTSVKKLMPLARQIAGKPIEEAIVQMRFSKKKVARDVKKHLEYARDKAIVERGMGLGVATAEYNRAAGMGDSEDAPEGTAHQDEQWPGMVVEDKKGKRRFVTDKSSIYVDEAWVGRGSYSVDYDFRAKGMTFIMRPPETSKHYSIWQNSSDPQFNGRRHYRATKGRSNEDSSYGRARAKAAKEEGLASTPRQACHSPETILSLVSRSVFLDI